MRILSFLALLSVASAQTITQPSASAINADFKLNVRVATTANITIATALNAGDTIDGVTLAAGDRVLVKNQSTASQNGIYIAGATPARASDADAWAELPGAFVAVGSGGSTTANKIYLCTATPTGTLGSTSITWAEKGAAGAGTGDALVADSLAQFAATTSSQLAGVISDEEGSGKAIFATGVSEGGNEAADAGKLLKFQAGGDIQGTTVKATDTAGYMYFTSQGEFAYKLAAWTNPAGINWPPDIGDGQSGNIASREWAATQYAPLTSPAIATSITTGSTTFALLNTTATTVNAFGAATTLNVGASAATVLNLGGAATAAQLRFLEPSGSGTNYMGFKAQAMAANVTYTLPAADGSSGQVLSTDGAGVLSWAAGGSGTPGGSTTQLQYNNAGAFGGISGATTNGTALTVTSGNLIATSPKFTTQICDTNGNPWIVQTATGSAAYGLQVTNAAAGGTVALASQTPTQAAAGIAGTPLSISASNGVAGNVTAGAVAGGSISLTAGNAAYLTSGSANGGSISLTAGTRTTATGGSDGSISLNGANGGALIGITGTNPNVTGSAIAINAGSGPTGGAIAITGGIGTTAGSTTGNVAISSSGGYATSGTVSLATGTPAAQSVSTYASGPVTVTTGAGGALSAASGTAGASGAVTVTMGAGGAESGNTSGTGGAGGTFTVSGGTGGAATGSGGTHTGGAGSAIAITSGAGGAATSASGTRTGGNSGTVTIGTGNGGNGTTTNGSSAALTLATGTAGAGAGAAGTVGSIVLSPGGTAGLTVSATSGIVLPKTISGATGNQTIDKASGAVLFANGSGTAITVTSSLVTANSVILATVASNDATLKSVAVVAGSGSFVIYPNAAPTTADCRVNFLITN